MAKNDIVISIGGDAKDFERTTDKTKKELKGLAKTTDALGGAFSALSGPVGIATKAMSVGFKAVTTAAKTASVGFGALGAAGTTALIDIVKTTADFEQSMANVASVTGGGEDAIADLSDAAREMGKTSVFSASQAAEAMYYLGSAGFNTEEVIDSLAGVMNLAGATMSELDFTAQTVVSTLSQFGMEAKDSTKVSNIFAAAIQNSQLTMGRLANGMRYIGPIAQGLGWTLEDTAAALGVLNNAGFMGEMAGTALRGAMTHLLNPTDAARMALEAVGVTMDMVNPETHSLAEIVDVLAGAGLSAGDAMLIFGQRAGPGMMALLGQGSQALTDLTKNITDTDAAAKGLETQTNTLGGAWKLLKSALQEVKLILGTELNPVLTRVVRSVTSVINAVGEWLKSSSAIAAWGLVVVTGISLVASAVLGLAGFFPMLAMAMLALAPIGVAVLAIFGFIAIGIRAFMGHVSKLGISWGDTGTKIKNTIKGVWEITKTSFGRIYEIVSAWWIQHLPKLASAFKSFQGDYETVNAAILAKTTEIWNKVIDAVEAFFTGENNTLDSLGSALDKFAAGDWKGGWEEIKKVFDDIWNKMTDAIEKWWTVTLPQKIREGSDVALDLMTPVLSALGVAFAKAIINSFIDTFKTNWGAFFGPGGWLWQAAYDQITGGNTPLKDAFENMGKSQAKAWWDAFFQQVKDNWGAFISPAMWAAQFGFDFFTGDSGDSGGSSGGSGDGKGSTTWDVPDTGYGQRSSGGSYNIVVNLPPGSSREQARHTAREINRQLQLAGGFAI